MMTRREALHTTALLTTAAVVAGPLSAHAQAVAPTGPHALPKLPYAYDALEPHIDAQTMQIHHGKHHQAYVTNLNKALAGHADLAKKPVQDLVKDLDRVPQDVRMAVRNNGGGHYNHSLFWQMLKKGGSMEPKGDLKNAIDKKFGSYEKFKEEFTAAATKVFGSGWAWLTLDGRELKSNRVPTRTTRLRKAGFRCSASTCGSMPII